MPQIENLITQLEAEADGYSPSAEVQDSLRRRTIIPVLGPFAVGKTTIMRATIVADDTYHRVRSFTTRQPRDGEDMETYDFLPHDRETLSALVNNAAARTLVQFMVHPTTKFVYGSRIGDYGKQTNVMLDVVPKALPGLEVLPFDKMQKIELVAEPMIWRSRMEQRIQEGEEDDIKARLSEGVHNLEWALDQGDDIAWVANGDEPVKDVAGRLIEVVGGIREGDAVARRVGISLLRTISEMNSEWNR